MMWKDRGRISCYWRGSSSIRDFGTLCIIIFHVTITQPILVLMPLILFQQLYSVPSRTHYFCDTYIQLRTLALVYNLCTLKLRITMCRSHAAFCRSFSLPILLCRSVFTKSRADLSSRPISTSAGETLVVLHSVIQ